MLRKKCKSKEWTGEMMESLLLEDACGFEALSDGGDALGLLRMIRIAWVLVLTHAVIVDKPNTANGHSCRRPSSVSLCL